MTDRVNSQLEQLKGNCPWFNPEKHFQITIQDMSGNIFEIIGCGSTMNNSKPALKAALRRVKNYSADYTVGLTKNNKLYSFFV